MQYISPPAIWLIVLIAGIGQLSETVYSPALPAIAASLGVKASWVEYTLTIYLLSFGIGTLFWGRLSDHFGRKPCVLAGIAIYIFAYVYINIYTNAYNYNYSFHYNYRVN